MQLSNCTKLTFLAFIMSSSSGGIESLLAGLFSVDLFLVFPVLNISFHKGERRDPLVLRIIPFLQERNL